MARHRSPRNDNRVCIRVVGQGMPIRCSREDARRIVEIDKDGEYCPKKFWQGHMRYVASKLPDSLHWPFSALFCRLNSKNQIEIAENDPAEYARRYLPKPQEG